MLCIYSSTISGSYFSLMPKSFFRGLTGVERNNVSDALCPLAFMIRGTNLGGINDADDVAVGFSSDAARLLRPPGTSFLAPSFKA